MRKRRKNPAELVLMGANPSKRRMHYAVQWNTGSLSNSYATRAEAEKILAAFNGKGRIVRANPIPLRRKNPTESLLDETRAIQIREGFVAHPVDASYYSDEPHMEAGNYAVLGKLAYLAVKPVRGGGVLQIDLEGRGIILVSAIDRESLYFVKGRHSLSHSEIEKFTSDNGQAVELGECRQIGYLAVKYHPEVGNDAAGKVVLWEHSFESPRPTVWYSFASERLLLKGGGYRVEDAGIVG
jgi:hypothetical protein